MPESSKQLTKSWPHLRNNVMKQSNDNETQKSKKLSPTILVTSLVGQLTLPSISDKYIFKVQIAYPTTMKS